MIKTEPKEQVANSINLLDVIPVFKPKEKFGKEEQMEIQNFIDKKNEIEKLIQLTKTYLGNSSVYEVATKLNNSKVINDFYSLREKFLLKNSILPEEIKKGIKLSNYAIWETRTDFISKLSESPKILGSDVKKIADDFGFCVMPFNCLNKASYEKEQYAKKIQIEKFGEGLESAGDDVVDIYVISPIEYYSINNHIKNNRTELPIYAGKHASVFASINISLPLFRNILNNIDSLQKTTNQNFESINISINQMQKNISELQKQINKQAEEQIRQNLEMKKVQLEIQRSYELRALDPIMIAIPSSVSINDDAFDNTKCFIGPCWGPDFSPELAFALNLKIVKNQRKEIEEKSKIWQN